MDDVDVGRAVRVAGAAGGPIDVRTPVVEGRPLEAADETRAFEGVFVLDTPALLGALTCFVGDFVGDFMEVSTALASCCLSSGGYHHVPWQCSSGEAEALGLDWVHSSCVSWSYRDRHQLMSWWLQD